MYTSIGTALVDNDMGKETIRQTFEEWNDWKLENHRIEKSSHLRNQQCFNRHYDSFGNRELSRIRSNDFTLFLEDQIPRFDLTSKAFSNLKSITKGFLKRAKRRGIIDWNVEYMLSEIEVSDKDFKKVVKEDYKEVFNEEETAIMLEYLVNNQEPKNLAILLMFVTGMRIGEVVALKKTDVEENYICVNKTETRWKEDGRFVYSVKNFPKTLAGVRKVVLPRKYSWLTETVKAIDPGSEWVFSYGGERIKRCMVEKRLETLCEWLGVYPKSPHKIRKTYISMLLDSNVDARFIMDQVGHADISVSERNYHRNRKTIEKKLSILDTIGELC